MIFQTDIEKYVANRRKYHEISLDENFAYIPVGRFEHKNCYSLKLFGIDVGEFKCNETQANVNVL